MKINELVLVIENGKGTEINSLMTVDDYEEFGTGMPDTFMENLDFGRYDSGFIETLKKEKGRVM